MRSYSFLAFHLLLTLAQTQYHFQNAWCWTVSNFLKKSSDFLKKSQVHLNLNWESKYWKILFVAAKYVIVRVAIMQYYERYSMLYLYHSSCIFSKVGFVATFVIFKTN